MATRKEIAQNQKILYDDAVANNMFQAAVPTFKEFQRRLEGQGYQKMVYDNYKKHNVKGKGFNNLNEFRGAFGGSFYADENKINLSNKAQAVSDSARQTVNNVGRYNRLKQRKQKQQKDFGRVNLGTHLTPYGGDANDVVKDEFAYNPETGKAGAYVTSDNENAYTQSDAEQKQAILDKYGEEWNKAVDMGMVPSELDKADPDMSDTDVAMRQMERRQEWLDENQNRRSKELNESMHLQDSPFVASGGAVAPSSFNTAIGNEANRLSDAEYGAYNTAKAYNQMLRTTLLQELKEQKQRNEDAGWWKDKWNDVSNYFGGMFDTMLDPKLYSQGVMDAAIASNLRQVKKGMEDGTIKKGSNAGNAAQVMLSAIQQQQGEAAKQQQNGAKAYQYGDVSGRSLKFMGDFALSGWRDVMTTGFTKAGEKVGEKMALGALGKWFTKNTGRVLGDMAGSAALAATNQLGSTYNNVIERYVGMNNENGGVAQDKDGDLKFNEGVSLGKAIKDGFGSATIENFSEMFGEYLPGASKLLSKLGLSKVSSFFEKIGNNAYYKWLSNATNKSGIQGVMSEIAEEEFGTALHAAWGDGDGSWSDFNVFTNPDAREKQIDTCLGMFYSVGFMQSPRTAVGAINAVKYFSIKLQVTKADKFGQMMFGDNWEEIKSKIDVTTNADLTKTVLDATRSDSMTVKQKGAVINYAMFLSKLRGFNQASDAKTKDKVEEGETVPTLSNYLDDAYTEGHNADDADKHDIQILHEDQSKTLAAALNISEQQLSGMSDEELESLTGKDDKLDQAIYDYQLSSARYQGVVDDAQNKVDLAAHQAEQRVNMYTDQSRGSVRNATIKASGGAEDYGVYIISGNIATHEDGSIDVSNSDDMILYYDPTTNSVEHADALMFAELGEELPADAVKAQAVADAKENAIKEVAGIIDGTVDVGSQFSVTDADGTEHTYEVLADNGDGTAMITIDGNVPTELVKGENVQIPYSFEDLQKMKDLEDQKRLETAKAQREQMEKERAGQQTQETEQTEDSQPSFDFNQILNDNGNVVLVDVLGKDGNTKYPGSKLFLIRDAGAKAKVVELKSDGTLVPHAVNKEDVRATQPMSLDEYKQAVSGSSVIEDNSGENRGEIEVETPTIEGEAAGPAEETATSESGEDSATEQTPAITLEDGTIVPMLEDGNPDFSKLTAAQTAELYDSQFGEDADGIVSGYVSDAKKALDKANNMTVKGKTFVEQKAAKDAKEKAIADAQATYDSAVAIRDAYNERQLAKEENTPEGRKSLIEKARRKYARLKNSEEWSERTGDLWNETVGKLLHRLYDATGIDVFDDTPNTVYEYVAENVGPYSLNYEGNDNSKGVQQETGLSRSDFAKLGWLAAEGKGMTIDAKVHRLWENRPSNLESADTQEIRNALISLITSGQTAFQARDYILNQRIELAESALEEQLRQEEDAAEAQRAKEEEDKKKAEEKTESPEKSNEESKTVEVPEDATDDAPLGEQLDESDLPFSAKENGQQQTTAERAADVEKNKVDDMKVVDNIVGQKTRKAFERLAKMMGANIQWQYSDKLGNGWIQETTDADGNVHRTIFITLDSSITEGAQFIFGHEMTHQIKNLNPAAYNELTQLVLDTYGSDAFDKAVDETMKRYSDAGFSGRSRDYYAEEVVADAVGEMIRDLNLAHTLAMKMSHPLLAAIHEILQKIKLAFYGTEYSDATKNIIRSIEQAYVKAAKGRVENSETGEDVSFSIRQKPEPKKKGVGYKVFVLKDGKLYPPMVANPDGAATPVGVWLDADAAPIAGESKTGRPQVKQGGKGTQGGSGKLAYRPGWHLGVVPYAIQFNRKDADGNKTLFPKNFVFAEVEYAADVDYQEEARQEGINPSGKYQHSLAGLKHLPTDGYYMYRTNPNPETDPWVITGAMKVNRILTRAEQAELVKNAGREPQQIQDGDIVTDDVVNSINQEIADAPKFSLKVYHGSGADFTEFDFNHMSEGAGSQTFGWGGYVTSSEKIGKSYAKITQQKPTYIYNGKEMSEDDFQEEILPKIGSQNENMFMDFLYNLEKYGVSKAKNILRKGDYGYYKNLLKGTSGDTRTYYEGRVKAAEVLLALHNIRIKKQKTNLYEVDIPEDNGSNYLDWDASIPSSINKDNIIKDILDNIQKQEDEKEDWELESLENDINDSLEWANNGEELYKAISLYLGDKTASKLLASLGYTGIKYKAGRNFGGAEKGDTNYVIFKPEDMKITEHTKFSIKTYHGSQASFDKFDHSFMGSGEGAQAYGWGTYVSEVEGIAKAYAKQNAKKNAPSRLMYQGKPMTYKTPSIIYQVAFNMDKFNISAKEAISKMIDADEKKLASVGDTPFAKMKAKQDQDELNVLKGLNPSDFKINDDYDTVAQNLADTKSGLDLLEDELKDAKSYVDLYQSRLDEAKEELSKAKESGTGLGVDMYESDVMYYSEQVEKYKQNVKTKESDIKDVKTKIDALQKKLDSIGKPRNLYSVDIPDDTGDNYIGWDEPITPKMLEAKRRVMEEDGYTMYDSDGNYDYFEKTENGKYQYWQLWNRQKGNGLYNELSKVLHSDKLASLALNKQGIVGVKVIADRTTGGNKEGKMNYVIFDENNAQITNHTKFSLRLKSAIEDTETNPSDAQKESGNYKKGHIKFGGYDYTIENPKGSTRSGKDANGKEWKVTMHDTYGYIRGKFGKDGDHLDMFINDKADLDNWDGDVFVVDQVNPDGSFDEHKVMYGYDSMNDAEKAYLANYSKGWKGLGNITGASKDEFDKWLDTSNRKLKPFADYAKVKFSQAQSVSEPRYSLKDIKPVGVGAFGNIYNQFRGNAKAAIEFLKKVRGGEAVGALHHKDIGDIDLVWGKEGTGHSDGYGLSKLVKYHPEVLDNLQEILNDMRVVSSSKNRVNLESETHKAGVRLTWDGERKSWLLTAFKKETSASDKRTDTAATSLEGDTALSQTEGSAAKIDNSSETAKENGEKFSLKDEKIKSVAEKFGVNEDDVAMYANAVERGSTADAARARANIKRYLLQANEDKISSFKDIIKYTKPINEALKENFGDLDAMIEERRKQVEAQRNAMEAARKRAQEEEEKRQKHLDELSLIPTDELDKRYMDAIANNDESTAREMLDESARRNGYGDVDSDYQGQGAWAAPSNPQYESDEARRADIENSPDVNLEDIALGYNLQPDDYFDNPRAYMNNTAYGLESAHVIKNALDAIKNGEKDVKVKVYRAVPTSVKEGKLRNGDWVTPSKKYAEMHGDNRLDGKYRIIEDEVSANQLWWDGNDVNEFGFDDGKEYRYKNAKNNRKLNDLVTYDNKGNVIPPSKRFNSRKSDIRFSLKAMMEKPEGWKQANKKAIHIAEAIERDPKFSLKNLDGTLIKAGTYFSGGGLVEEGLKGIIDPVVAVEYDEKISGVYRNNFGQHIVTADVRDVDPKELVKQIDGEVEYFHASPVCKNYSQAKSNHAEVELDKETAASTAEFINAIKPKVVTIENVKGYKDSEAMKTITDALDANGYTWDADVYNAADYGGYTNRERLIVRAVRDGKLPEKPKKMARKSGWYEAVADIIPTLTEKKNGVAPWMDIRLKADGIDWRNIDKPLYVMGSAYADGKIPHAFADELLPTLRTKSGDVIVMPDGKVYRAMGRVLARVSGVSDDYKMPFSENLSHTIIGNGIPTQLTEHVIAPLLTGSDPKFSIRTYHGTGAKFDKFDFSHMGEGEGSQAFGWGGYVTNSKDIAEDYTRRAKIRKDNGGFDFVTDMSANNKDMVRQYIYKHKDVNKGLDAMRKDLPSAIEMFPDDDDLKELSNILAKKNEEIAVPDNIAYLYDVDIPDDNGDYLDWDAPLTDKQKNTIIKELRRLKIDFADFKKRGFSFDGSFGGNSYDFLMYALRKTKKWKDVDASRAVSKFLSSIGFTGIKYKAGTIFGGAKEGDYNYVIFDENNANIVGNTRFSLRYDQFEHDLNQWKKDNNLPKDAKRPTIPQRNAGESAVDFLRRVDEYRKQMALWKTAPTYEQHLLSDDTALGEFNRELQRGSVLKRIAFQDSMLAIRKAQEAIIKEVGVDRLNMAEDAYTAENRSHGKGKNEFEEYNNEFLQPLRKAYHQMKKVLGDSYDNVRLYMMAKHGLERNAQMAFKKSLEADYEDVAQRSAAYKAYKGDIKRMGNDSGFELGLIDYATWVREDNAIKMKYSPSYMKYRYDKMGIAFDYSGLSALFDGSDFEEAAHKLVRDIESKHIVETKELWDATNAATKKILRDGYKAGMMSKDTYQYVRDMYSHYIPLRGWDGTTADQVWDYVGGGNGAFNQTLKKAHGRTSIADDPIAYIENMAESGILLNNKNWVKQHLMLLAQNHPTSLLTLSKAWYVKSTDANGNEEWIPATPQITSQMNSNQVKAAIDAFEQKMEQMEQTGDATQKRDGLNIAYPQTHSEEREHEVRVMKDGEEYVIYVNGDPQLAQAMNNTRAHRVREIQSGKLDRAAAWLGRKMAAAYTSLSPLFIPSNYFRDLTMTLASTAIREDGRYNYLLRKNLATSWNLGFMLRDYQNGKLRDKVNNGNATPKEQMFYDFMMNGGETGFVSSLDVEDLKKKFKNDLKDLDRWKANPVKVGHTIMDGIEFLNRAIEDSNRFAIYRTSIQYGRSIDEAVNDAKDVTLNFNRKGTGEYGWQMIRNLYLFINPAVQSLQTLGALVKHHPFKFTAVTASWIASGVLVPIVNAALMSLLGGDDDKDKYWQFTKWDRRNNLIMWIPFTHEYVKIPLAQEFRAFYGVGDMIASKMMGGELAEESWSQYAEDLLGQVVDMLPLDPTGYDGNIAVSLMPNAIRPIFELAFNVDFTGKPLFKDTEYNKYDPNFTKAYVGTPDWLVRASRMVNSIGNDYPDVQQNSIDAFGDPRYNLNNPGVVDHVLSSYLGGAYTMGSQVLGVLTKSLNDPKEIKVADIPLFSKFVSNPDDRPVAKKQGDEFWDMKENHDRAANTLSKLKKQAKVDGDYSMLERFYGSEEYKQYKQDDAKVKKYEEDKKKERAEESGEEYRPHQINAEDIYNNHATPMDEFEDMKLKQLYTKLNGFKSTYDLLVDMAPNQREDYYNANKAAIDAINKISLRKQKISEHKKGFLNKGKDAYNDKNMSKIRELRKSILSVLEKANKVVVANQKAKAKKK